MTGSAADIELPSFPFGSVLSTMWWGWVSLARTGVLQTAELLVSWFGEKTGRSRADLLPGHVCPSPVLSSFWPGKNSTEEPHKTSVMKRHQAGSGTSIFMEGFCCGIPCNNSAPSGFYTKHDKFSQNRHHSCSRHCNGFAGAELPAFSRTCWKILIPSGGEQIQLRFSVHK